MKATFFTLATMAASVFAAPAPVGDELGGDLLSGAGLEIPEVPAVPGASGVPEADSDGLVGELVGGLPKPKAPTGVTETRQLPDAPTDLGGIDGLVELLTGLVDELTGSFGNISMSFPPFQQPLQPWPWPSFPPCLKDPEAEHRLCR